MLNQAAFEKAEERVLKTERELAKGLEYRNSLLPVNSLPTEILFEILLTAQGYPPSWRETAVDWLGLTQVCRHWRDVAFGCPSLWSKPDFWGDPAFTDLMISRSGTAPLIIEIGISRRTPDLDTLFLHYHRFRTIAILCLPYSSEVFSAVHKITPSTTLQNLIIRGSHQQDQDVPPALVQTLSECPNLEHLSIIRCHFSWSTLPVPPKLIFLRLHNTNKRAPEMLSWTAVRTALASMPALEVLDLEFMLAPKDPQCPLQDVLSLPNMDQSRLVESDMATMTNFLSNVALSKTSIVEVDLGAANWEPTDGIQPIVDLLSALKASRSGHASSPQTNIHQVSAIHIQSPTKKGDRFATAVWLWCGLNLDLDPLKDLPTFELHIPFDVSAAQILADAVKATFDISRVRYLCVEDKEVLGVRGWTPFTQLPVLETIHVQATTISPFVALLSDPGPAGEPPFPGLCNIIFEDVDFDEDRTGELLSKIGTAVAKRQKDHPLIKVSIWNCKSFGPIDAEALRKVVEVDWDGKVTLGSE